MCCWRWTDGEPSVCAPYKLILLSHYANSPWFGKNHIPSPACPCLFCAMILEWPSTTPVGPPAASLRGIAWRSLVLKFSTSASFHPHPWPPNDTHTTNEDCGGPFVHKSMLRRAQAIAITFRVRRACYHDIGQRGSHFDQSFLQLCSLHPDCSVTEYNGPFLDSELMEGCSICPLRRIP